MGNVLVPAVYAATFAISLLLRRPNVENPTLVNIRVLQGAQQAQRDAERAARTAQEFLEQIQLQLGRNHEQAQLRQEEADRAAARATEEAAQLRGQMEDVARVARRARELAEAARHAAREEAEQLAREARVERERAQRMREEAEGSMTAAKEEAERAQRAADEERREAEAAKEMASTAEQEARKAIEAQEEAERNLKGGIRPVVIPSATEVAAAKQRIQYSEDCFHFAIAGISGSGKSSLVNAFRSLRSQDPGAAAVGVIETTLEMARYPDPNPDHPFVWYDIPGAGTFKCRDWQYFNDQGLYVFDCIIVLFDNRFTMTDIAILTNASRFQIPTYIVRSKADQHIRNIMNEMGYNSEGNDEERRSKLYKAARKQFIDKTRRSVQTNLRDADLPDQRVYIVSNTTTRTVVLNKMPKRAVDDVELVNDLLHQAYSRRVTSGSKMNHGPTR